MFSQITPVSKQHAYGIGITSMLVSPPLTGLLLDSNTSPPPHPRCRLQGYRRTDAWSRGRVVQFSISLRSNTWKWGLPRPDGVEVGTPGCRAVRSPEAQLCRRSPGRTAARDVRALRRMVLTPLHVQLLPTGDSGTCWVFLSSSCTSRSCRGSSRKAGVWVPPAPRVRQWSRWGLGIGVLGGPQMSLTCTRD